DQTRVEPVERVAPRKQADRAPLVEIDDSANDSDEVFNVRLEQLIARVGLEHVEYGLAVVSGRVESEILDDSRDFPAQHGNVTGTAVVGARRPQPEKAVLADDAALRVESLETDVVEILAPVHGCGRVGFGDDEHFAIARTRAHLAAEPR